jgi:hypothetical protein
VCIESVGHETRDQFLDVGVLEVDKVTGAIECEAVLSKGAAKPADRGLLFEEDRIVFEQVMSRAKAREASTDNDDLLTHARLSIVKYCR